jgi:hypothetical protein
LATPPASLSDAKTAIAPRMMTQSLAGTQNTIRRIGRSGKYIA